MMDKPFGSYRLPSWGEFLVSICQKIPTTWLGKRVVFILRKPVLLLKQSPIDAEVKGARFRLYPGSNLSDKRLLCTPNLLDGEERNYFAQVLDPGSWLVDLGANIGGYSLLLAAERQDISAVAVEADPELVERLQQNIDFSGLQQRVTVVNAAVTEVPGTLVLERDAVNRGKNTVAEKAGTDASGGDRVEVVGMTLLDIMDSYGIHRPGAVKLDIEGHELPVLRGFFTSAPRERWPRFIQLEQHRAEEETEASQLAKAQGYRLVKRTRMNVVLTID